MRKVDLKKMTLVRILCLDHLHGVNEGNEMFTSSRIHCLTAARTSSPSEFFLCLVVSSLRLLSDSYKAVYAQVYAKNYGQLK